MSIKTSSKKLKENQIELSVEVSGEKFKEAVANSYKEISKKAKIPGFRAGKIPAKVIESNYGKDYIIQQALEVSIPVFYSQAVHESGIQPIDTPQIEVVSAEEGKELKFKAQVQVEPKADLPAYKDIKVEFEKPKVGQEEIKGQLDMVRNRFAELNLAPNKVADEGDHVMINFDGTVDGKAFDGGSAQNFMVEIGSKTLMPEFEKQLVGSKAGDIKNIVLQMPPQLPNEEIAGKTANFKVLVKEVKTKKLPEMTDKFVKDNMGMDTVKDLEKEIKKDMQAALDKQSEGQYSFELAKQLAEKSKIEMPKKMIDLTIEDMMKEFEDSLKRQGTTKEHYLQSTKTSEEDLRKNIEKSAEERARQEVAIKTLIEKEKIEVTDKDIDKEIEALSKDKDKPMTRQELDEKGLLSYLKSNILYKKAVDLLATKVKEETK